MRGLRLFLSAAIAAFAMSASALAQTAPAGTGQASLTTAPQLSEVIVTAERRSENEQKTPISMQVYSSSQLEREDITDFAALSTNDTSVNLTVNTAQPYIAIRGVSSSDITEIGDPAVPVDVDDFTTIRSYSLNTDLYDVNRIEVLRGPQGTLFGRNAEGGLINVITNQPTGEEGAGGSLEFGNYNTENITGWINLPVSDTFWLRGAFMSRQHDGYRDIIATPGSPATKGDDEDSQSGRLEALFQPTDNFSALLIYSQTKVGGVGPVDERIAFIPNPDQATHPGDIDHNMPNLGNTDAFPLYGPQSQDIEDKTGKWHFTYTGLPGGITLRYLGGYQNLQWHDIVLWPGLWGDPFEEPNALEHNEYPKTQNQEFRVSSDASGPFIWQAGVYYFEERSTDLYTWGGTNYGTAAQYVSIDFKFPQVETSSRAVYGQGSYVINSQNKITLGARYNEDTKERIGIYDLQQIGLYDLPDSGSSRNTETTWHAGYDYQPTAENLIYAKADKGYKPGGFTTCAPYSPETVTSFEVGSKNRAYDNRIQINGAVFDSKYDDQQIAGFAAGCPSGTVVQNAGHSTIYGFEGELTALLPAANEADLHMTLLHARFDNFLAAPTIGAAAAASCAVVIQTSGGPNCQLAGNMLPMAPNLTIAAGLSHTFILLKDATLVARIEDKYTTYQYFDPFNFGDTRQPGYGLLNAYLTYDSGRNWTVSIYGRNLANKTYLVDAAEAAAAGAGFYRYGFGAPLTFGMKFQYGR